MTRRSKREVERGVEDLSTTEEFTLQGYLWADLKDAHGGRLTRGERRLLDNPEAHLPASALRKIDGVGGSL